MALGCALGTMMVAMMANSVSVHLAVSAQLGQVRARLAFKNSSNRDVFIEKYNACAEQQIENNVFEIRTNGHLLDYTGMLAKRRRPIPQDYLIIRPGEMFETEVDLTKAYAFPKELREYVVVYSAVISYPDRDGVWMLKSNPVRFRFRE
jgi:hypothetical protein